MRKVKVSKLVGNKDNQGKYCPGFHKEFDYNADFHAWGVAYEDMGENAGNYSTAIVEKNDGTVENVEVELIQFEFDSNGNVRNSE